MRACNLLTLAGALALVACSFPSKPRSASFAAKPIAAIPRVSVEWRKDARIDTPWDFKPLEFATPQYLPDTEDLVLATSAGEVSRLRAGNGAKRWRVTLVGPREERGPAIHASPVVSEKFVFAATLLGSVHALDLEDGEQKWVYEAEDAVEGGMAISEGRLLFMDAREILYALDLETGKMLWRYQRRTPEFFTIKGSGTPVVRDGVVYCGFADGTLVALQLETGEVRWQADLSSEQSEFTDIDMRPIVGEGALYVASYAGGIHAVSLKDGAILWRVPVESVSRLARDRNTLYAASAQGRVVALDLETHRPVWSFRFKEQTPVALTARGPYVFVSTSTGPLYTLDAASGYPLARFATSGGMNTPLVLNGHKGYMWGNDGALMGVSITQNGSGKHTWFPKPKAPTPVSDDE